MNIRHISMIIIVILLAAGAFACGGGSDPVVNDPGVSGNTGGATLTGRILDREGNPVGKPWVDIKLTVSGGGDISPALQPQDSGPDAGVFRFIGLPMGIPMTLEIGLFQVSIGRNLGYIHKLTLTTVGTYDLGDIVLENDFLDNGWNSYLAKDYTLALINFNRAFEDRFLQADLTYSSSAYTGIGWVYAKRGKDCTTSLYYVDDSGWVDSMNSYEWDQAILNFDHATANLNDVDAWVGMGGTYLTLLGQSNKDPVLVGPWIPYYGFISYYFDDAQSALEKALILDPDYKCSHDKICANDLRATILFLKWMQGQQVTVDDVNALSTSPDLNQGSLQLLEIMPDIINYNPFPQL